VYFSDIIYIKMEPKKFIGIHQLMADLAQFYTKLFVNARKRFIEKKILGKLLGKLNVFSTVNVVFINM